MEPPPPQCQKPDSDPDSNPDKQQEGDVISTLPDSILSHILSKLPTETAFATSLTWKNKKQLFSQIPNPVITILDSHFLGHVSPSDSSTLNRLKANFTQFVTNLLGLILREVPRVEMLVVYLSHVYDEDQVNAWVSVISRINVSELFFFFRHVGITPDAIFRCQTVTGITLGFHTFPEVSSSISLPNLTMLNLIEVAFASGGSLERLITACPLLDSLIIRDCTIDEFVDVLRISSSSVKKLQICRISGCCGDATYEVVLDTPAIESIHCVDCLPESYSVILRHAREAHIDVGPTLKQLEGEDVEEIWLIMQSVRDLVEACSTVRSLFLSKISVNALPCSRPMPTFHNLTRLELGCININGWRFLPEFLESVPNLKVLLFKKGFSQYEGCYEAFQSNVTEHAPRCLTFHLHTIKFEAFKGEEDEIKLVEYFLKQAHLLRKINFELSCSLSSDTISLSKSRLWSSRSQLRKLEVDFAFKVEIDWQKLSKS